MKSISRHFLSLALLLILTNTAAAVLNNSYTKWSSIYASTPLFGGIPSCAQSCLEGVDAFLSCWSTGCVCSEGTPGLNFVNGTRYVANCARASCPAADAAAAVDAGLAAFQGLCGVSYSPAVVVTTVVSYSSVTTVVTTAVTSGSVTTVLTTTTVVAGPGSTVVATTMTTSAPAEATPTFDCELETLY